MLLENTLEAHVRYALGQYRDVPSVLNGVFVDGQCLGVPDTLAPGQLVDTSQRWIPHFFDGGRVVIRETVFPILANDRTVLTLDGDPSPLWTLPPPRYTILIPDTARLAQWLTENPLPLVVTTFAQIPNNLPCISMRLEQDAQGETYAGEQVLPASITTTGVEVTLNMERVLGRYLFGIWTQNRDASLWLYALLRNLMLGSIQVFASWGVGDVSQHGLDVDPVLGFLPEYPHTRHLAVTLSRFEQAINLAQLEAIDRTRITPCLAYAPLWPRTTL